MITIRVHLSEKRSTSSQYENATVGAAIEAQNLELVSAEDIARKTRELFQICRGTVQQQLLEPVPSAERNGHEGNGHVSNGNGRRRAFGRPTPEPTAKQRQFLRQIARERDLDAQTVGETCERVVGVPLRSCTRDDLSKLIDALLEERAR